MTPFDAKGSFRPTTNEAEVRHLAVRGAGVTVLSSGMGLVIQVVATVVLARLLTPADFGLVTMVTTFSLLLLNLGLNGITEAVVQREEISHALASNLFWINVGMGLLLTVAFAAAGSLLAKFYGNPVVVRVAIGISLTIIVSSTSVLHLALLKRAMLFTTVSANDLVANGLSIALSIVLAWMGWGFWALVAGAVARPLLQSIGAWGLCRWIPGAPRRVPGTASALRFAIHVYGRFSVNYSARNLDNLLVGWYFNAQALGFYKKAYDLFALSASQLTSPLTNVAVSALSRLRSDSDQYRRYLINSLAVMAFLGMGLGGILTFIGKDLIRLLLGPGWEMAGRIFTYFGPGIGIMLLYCTHGWIHLSIGRADRWFRWGIVELVATAVLFIIGLRWGPVGIAVAWTLSFWLLTVPAFWYAGKPINLGVGPFISTVWKYVFASLLADVGSLFVLRNLILFSSSTGLISITFRIFWTAFIFSSLYLLAVILLHGSLAPVSRVLRLLREMVPRNITKSIPENGIPDPAASEVITLNIEDSVTYK